MISLGILPNGHPLIGGKNKRRNLLEQILLAYKAEDTQVLAEKFDISGEF